MGWMLVLEVKVNIVVSSLSIKLAEIELMESITTESPILLLDDVMSELDNTRQLKLLETISHSIQTFITTTSLDHLQNPPKI